MQHTSLIGIAALAASSAAASAPVGAGAASGTAEEIVVVGVPTRMGLPIDWVPAHVQTLGSDSLAYPGSTGLAEALSRRLGSISTVDALGNPLQAGLALRGFTAAPALGEPQGIVVYQGPMRVNEAFGDVVQWDLLPVFAIAEAQVISGSNPIYGPNSIGGAVALTMKHGFDTNGFTGEAAAGSFGRTMATAEYGTHRGNLGLYVGVNAIDERGWRDASPSQVVRGFADLQWATGPSELGFSLTAADSRLTGNGPAPADLLAERRQAVFTHPDRTNSSLWAGALRALLKPAKDLALSGGAYYRRLQRATVNGDRAEFPPCAAFLGRVPGFAAPGGALCFGAESEGELGGQPAILVDPDGVPIATPDGAVDAVFNRTRTRTSGWGASAQAIWRSDLAGAENALIVGASLDGARTRYRSGTEVGTLEADRGVNSLGVAIGNAAFNVGLRTRSRSYSVYASNTLSPMATLHVTTALRWNRAELRLRDEIGTALNGNHRYMRLNPAVGVSWGATPRLTAYAAYARNNRVPTPAELSCADPARPCRFPNAFLADPPLDDVRARTIEAGLRGTSAPGGRDVAYALAAFSTTSKSDIIFISAGPVVGSGYFDNVGGTRRRGIEANLRGRTGDLAWHASYALVDATFRTSLVIQAPDNPGAEASGEIAVASGDRIPGIPRHMVKAGADLAVSDTLTLGAEIAASGRRYLRGDEANLQQPIGGFVTVGASASYRVGQVELFARITNILDAKYATFGIYGDADELGFEDPRFLSPGAPRTLLMGIKTRI